MLGETPSTMDIKTFITADNTRVNILSLLGVIFSRHVQFPFSFGAGDRYDPH